MNIRQTSFSVLYGIQRSFLNLFYLISIVAVFWLVFYLLNEVLSAGGAIIIPVSIAYLVLGILGYGLLQVISYIPANLAGAFDPIKNGTADRSIDSAYALACRVADFLCEFFDFAFFDIESSVVVLSGYEAGYSRDGKLENLDLEEIERHVKDSTGTFYHAKQSVSGAHIYIVPVIFGDTRLGFIVVQTRQKLRRMFVRLLDELENDYLDDQVMHVLSRQKGGLS